MSKRDNGKGTLRKRVDGRWEGRYQIVDENGKPKTKYILAKSKAECQEKLEKFIDEYENSIRILEQCPYLIDPNPTFAEWSEIWLESFCKDCIKYYTYNGYKVYIEKYINPRIGNLKLSEISTVVCQQLLMDLYKNGRIKKSKKYGPGLAIKTVKDIKITLQACMQKAFDEDLIKKNPVKKIKLPTEAPKEMKTLKAADIQAFLDEAKRSNCYEFYYLELSTGLRLGEILALTWDDLDPINKTISINKQVQKIGNEVIVGTPKTANSIRTISISQGCIDLLLGLKKRQPLGTELMFPSRMTGTYQDPKSFSSKLHRIQKRAGVEEIRFHDLRHSFATLSLEQGMDIKTISHMLGHSDAGFTMNTYMHVTDKMQQTVADTMGELLSNPPTNDKIIKFA